MGNEVRARAYRVSIAGPVGSGKTALVDRLSKELYPARNLSPDVWKFGAAMAKTAITFMSHAALAAGLPAKLGLKKMTRAVRDCRNIGKAQMLHNSATPNIEVDPKTYEVRVDGHVITCEPATVLPLAQRYFLF